MTVSPRNQTGGEHTGLELEEGTKDVKFIKIPETEDEKTAQRPPRNEWLPATLRSEAFDNYD